MCVVVCEVVCICVCRSRAVEVLSSQAFVQETKPHPQATPVRPDKLAPAAPTLDPSRLLEHQHPDGVPTSTCELCRWEVLCSWEVAHAGEEQPPGRSASVLPRKPKVFVGFPRHPCTLRRSGPRAYAPGHLRGPSRAARASGELLSEALSKGNEKQVSTMSRTRGSHGSRRGKRQNGEYDTLLNSTQIQAVAAGVRACLFVCVYVCVRAHDFSLRISAHICSCTRTATQHSHLFPHFVHGYVSNVPR